MEGNAMQERKKLYWTGNVAKSGIIEEILGQTPRPTTIFDFGCGDGGDWPSILTDHPWIKLIGYEPYGPSAQKATARLRTLPAEIHTGKSIDSLNFKADYIVSFSVFEHVIDRQSYLANAKRFLSENGIFYLNYDDGHFRYVNDLGDRKSWMPAIKSLGLTLFSGVTVKVGLSTTFQKRVAKCDIDRLVDEFGFHMERCSYNNMASMKELAKTIPEEQKIAFAQLWLELEKTLNEKYRCNLAEEKYADPTNLWRQMGSRTLVLKHKKSLGSGVIL
ncbi:MAG: methyltransferase domain-containing protein [Alphaproteobacteria bacterium]|nr:methyltransferase domain-containing protein [Alphaproteobacteria bacterium]